MTKGIVPSLGGFVKNVVGSALIGIEVETSEFGVSMAEKLSLVDAAEAIRRLLAVDNGVSMRTRFGMGDVYRCSPKNRGIRDTLAKMIFGPGITKSQRQLLSTYGWVAGKWPIEQRTERHNWSWYLTHHPVEGEDAAEDQKKRTPLELMSVEREGVGVTLVLGREGKKQRFSYHANEVELERILAEMRSNETSAIESFFRGPGEPISEACFDEDTIPA